MAEFKNTVTELMIAREYHKDGTPHLHAYVKLSKQYRCQGKHKRLILHGHYPDVRYIKNKYATIRYLKKEDEEPLVRGLNVHQYIKAKETKSSILGKRILAGDNLEDIVKDQPGLLANYNGLKKSIDRWQMDTAKPYEADGVRGMFIYGPPGTGKSRFVRNVAL